MIMALPNSAVSVIDELALMPTVCQAVGKAHSSRSSCRMSPVDLAGDVALDAADGFASGAALGGAPVEVVAGALFAACAGQGDAVEGGVGAAVAAAVESVPSGFAGGCLDRADAAEGGEGGFAVQPVGVVAGGDEQSRGAVRADAVALQQLRGVGFQHGGDLLL